jgi:hypothetical protein
VDMQKLIERFAGVPSWIAAPCMALAMAQAAQAADPGFVVSHSDPGFVVTKTELPPFKPVTIPVAKPIPIMQQFSAPASCSNGSCGQQRRGLFGRRR